jgi:hypothetical protein
MLIPVMSCNTTPFAFKLCELGLLNFGGEKRKRRLCLNLEIIDDEGFVKTILHQEKTKSELFLPIQNEG